MDFVATARKAGVRIMAGTDAWNPYVFAGFSIHDELEWFVQAGLSPHQSLQAATTDPAEFLGMRDSLGAVRAGFLADLVLLEENPLVDIGATRGIIAVVAAGRVFNADSREQLLAQAEAAARRPPGG